MKDLGNKFDGCVYQLDSAYFDAFMPVKEAKELYLESYYPGGLAKYNSDNTAFFTPSVPFRYDTKQMYGFCLPTINTDSASAFGQSTIDTFEKLF